MSVAITAQAPVESFASSATASPQADQGTGATTEKGLVDFFAKAHLDAGLTEGATNSVAQSGAMIGKLREFIDKAQQSDAKNHATRIKQREAAAQANIDLATMDTLGSLGSLSQFNPLGQSGSLGQLASLNQFAPVGGLHPGPASAPGPGLPGLGSPDVASPGRLSAMADKMTNDLMDSAIYNMWTQVVVHSTTSLTKNMMTLLKGQ
jgi:hypothetical protein